MNEFRKPSSCLLWLAFIGMAAGNAVLRDVHFKEGYSVNELPPTPDGKPLHVSSLEPVETFC
jgi:hypothetical protein